MRSEVAGGIETIGPSRQELPSRVPDRRASPQPLAFTVILAGRCSHRWRGLERLLSEHPGFAVVRYTGPAHELWNVAGQLKPCIVLLSREDLALGGQQPPVEESGRRGLNPSVRVLVAEESNECAFVGQMVRAGYWGLIQPSAKPRQLWRAIQAVARGELWAGRAVLTRVIAGLLPAVNFGLTARESEILQLIVQGCRNQEIAERLFISLDTVRWHLRSLYKKLGVRDRADAARCAGGLWTEGPEWQDNRAQRGWGGADGRQVGGPAGGTGSADEF